LNENVFFESTVEYMNMKLRQWKQTETREHDTS